MNATPRIYTHSMDGHEHTHTSQQMLDETAASAQIDFGFTDAKGRAIGMQIKTVEATFTDIPDFGSYRGCWSHIPAGYYFGVSCQITRNGQTFGAGQGWQYFRTSEERQAWIDKHVADRKRVHLRNVEKAS